MAQRKHRYADARDHDAELGSEWQDFAGECGGAEKHEQKRGTPGERVDEAEIPGAVGEVDEGIVDVVQHRGGGDEAPAGTRRLIYERDQSNPEERGRERERRDREESIGSGFDECIPPGVQHRRQKWKRQHPDAHSPRPRFTCRVAKSARRSAAQS
jgi:hypothetical protein